ncbi:Aste57867_10424 [Aphanomyces stellatus]|uniref:Aste57867_10424 protein n=1 Tax=Aphanomyces stellatus TaxID=120398 RepID=A0A485KQU9_9STRA|nr:hypothetical protein As57867_010384 [Aphanomyces stellatus]VFT87298.1 Aste57867_10424 [Aphanomyces stellatus]
MSSVEWWKAASVAVGAVMLLSMGSAYVISSWNNQMKDMLHMTQTDITAVSSCFTFGQFNLLWPGMFYDRFGARWSALASATLLGVFYWTASALTAAPDAPHWYMAACFAVIGLAHAFPTITGIAANEGLYGEAHRGKIMGLMASSYSGGGALFALLYHVWFDQRVGAYFHFMGWEMLLVCLAGVVLLKHTSNTGNVDYSQDEEAHHLLARDMTMGPLLRTRQFWYLFVAVMFGVGCPLFVMNNLSFIVESNGGNLDSVPTLVLTFSLVNLAGRFAMGAVSDAFLKTVPRTRFLAASIFLVGLCQLLFLVCPVEAIVVPVVLTGFAEGCVFGVFPILIRELFGARHFGKNYGLVGLANAVGFPLVLGPLSSSLYRLHLTPGTEKCTGSMCFTPMFVLTAVLSGVAWLCALRLRHSR